jgi:hypothetical protein
MKGDAFDKTGDIGVGMAARLVYMDIFVTETYAIAVGNQHVGAIRMAVSVAPRLLSCHSQI